MSEQEAQDLRVVYLGRTILEGGKEGIAVAPLTRVDAAPDRVWRDASAFLAKSFTAFLVVGGVYDCKGLLDDAGNVKTIRTGSPVFVERYPAADIVASWEAQSEAVKLTLRTRSREKAMAENGPLREHVTAIRDAYRAVPPAYRAAFKLWLMEQL